MADWTTGDKQDLQTMRILGAVLHERRRQIKIHGDTADAPLIVEDMTMSQAAAYYHILEAEVAKAVTDNSFANGFGTYVDILNEEVCELVEALALGDEDGSYVEAIQVAAVAVAIAERFL